MKSLSGQDSINQFSFINLDLNFIDNAERLSELVSSKANNKKPLSILHIGDSHLQAGFLTEKIKQNLLIELEDNETASPGFIFPYAIAQTNNPYYFTVSYKGNWEYCKNVDAEKKCKLGLSGITLQTKDSIAEITIKFQNHRADQYIKYLIDQIKILHEENSSAKIYVNNQIAQKVNNFSFVNLGIPTDSVAIRIEQEQGQTFNLYGLIPDKVGSKINYHTIGVNGATAQSYLKCDYFSDHLKLLNPDIIILSLGTNDAYADDFNPLEHEFIFRDLVLLIRNVSNAEIICATANDHQKNRQYNNKNVNIVNDNIKNICAEKNLSCWDFYTIMGGENSILEWYNKNLSADDKLHFKKIGYHLQGDLFTNAFLNLFDTKRN